MFFIPSAHRLPHNAPVSATPTHMLRICVNSPLEKALYPLFLLTKQAQKKKLLKRKRRAEILRSAERDKGSSPLTQPPFEKGGRKLYHVQKGRKNHAFFGLHFFSKDR